ncbi:MAG: hypothetical protein JSU03_07245 [Bacteroidetes bacterium]|nr:hypothetical protein [Bacteroidota bacterium]MBS1757057.1 hypothetical protein [Bacteroidota bacterium]
MTSKTRLIFLTAGTVIMMIVMTVTGRPMKHPATPMGIVNLELASNADDVQNILNAWDNDISQHRDVLADAITNTWLDFILIIFYSFLFYFLCRISICVYIANPALQKAGKILSYAALIAGTLDYGENIGMLTSLNGHVSNAVAIFTATCSTCKWILVFAVILYLIFTVAYKYLFKSDFKKSNVQN